MTTREQPTLPADHPDDRGGGSELRELGRIGAAAAADTLSRLLGCEVRTGAPRLRGPAPPLAHPRFAAAVLFEAHGDQSGLVAIALPAEGVDAVARAFLGVGGSGAAGEALRSALCELGNIVASHAMSALADAEGGRILPSLPLLVMDGEEPSFDARVAWRQAAGAGVRVESEIVLELGGGVQALLVWVPDPRKRDSEQI